VVLGSEMNRYAMGCGGVQALCLAMIGIGSRLYSSEEFKSGRLTYLEGRNLGFPMYFDLAPDEGIDHSTKLVL
jgi:hypothetical protein